MTNILDTFSAVFITSQHLDCDSLQVNAKKKADDLYRIFRPYLIFGRILGVVPIQKLLQRDVNNLNAKLAKKISLGALFSCFVIGISLLWLLASSMHMYKAGKSNASEIVNAADQGIFCLIGIMIYGYFLFNAKALIKLFQKWNGASFYFCHDDVSLSKDIAIVTAIMFTTGVMENVLGQYLSFPVSTTAYYDTIKYFNLSKNASVLEVFYYREYVVRSVLPYTPLVTLLLFLCNKLILYAWTYMDILITLVSRVFYFRYNSLIEIGLQKISSEKDLHDPIMWKSLALDHMRLSDILEEFQEFFSPLVLLSYTMNTFFSCRGFHGLVTPSPLKGGIFQALWSAWAVGQVMIRALIVTISAGRVNENAREILNILYKCPPECYIPEVERTERRIQFGKPLSFHAMQCFQVTKSLYLRFLSVLLTYEIVLIQATGSDI